MNDTQRGALSKSVNNAAAAAAATDPAAAPLGRSAQHGLRTTSASRSRVLLGVVTAGIGAGVLICVIGLGIYLIKVKLAQRSADAQVSHEAQAAEPIAPRHFDEMTPLEASGQTLPGAAPASAAPFALAAPVAPFTPVAPFAGPSVPGVTPTRAIPLAPERVDPAGKSPPGSGFHADSSASSSSRPLASYHDSAIDVDTVAPRLGGVAGPVGGATPVATASAETLGLRPEVLAALRQSGAIPGFSGGSSSSSSNNNSNSNNSNTGVVPASVGAPARAGSIGGELTPSAAPRVRAAWMGERNLLLGKGASIPCGLGSALDSSVSGLTTCTVSRNVFSENGKVLLIERGSHIDGEYVGSLKTGQQRLFVLWDRIRTTRGVTIELASPAADALGRSGLEGQIDRHWAERIGGAFMLSLVQDAVGAWGARQASANGNAGAGTQLFSNTQQVGESLASKVLASTLNIAPTFSKNQGDRVNVIVARDLDFAGVYELGVE